MTTIIFATKPAVDSFVGVADTQTTAGIQVIRGPNHVSKMFSPTRADHLLLGCAGNVSVKTALKTLNIPSKPKNIEKLDGYSAYDYMGTVVVPAMKKHLESNFNKSSVFSDDANFSLLVWIKGTEHVFEVDRDFSVTQSESGFYSIGSGSYFAQSSFKLRPDADIVDHMKFAAENDLFTSGPFHLVKDDIDG